MSHLPDDADLKERFAALRREDAALLAPFRVTRPQRAPARRLVRWVAAAALATAAATALWLVGRDREFGGRIALDLGATMWSAPTDFLLETPGRDLLRGIPELGATWRELP